MTKQEIVEHNTVMPCGGKRLGAMAPDMANTTGDKYSCHDVK